MTSELSKDQKCIILRNGIEIWIDVNKAEKIEKDIVNGGFKGFIYVEGNLVNMADMIGIFAPRTIEKRTDDEKLKQRTKHGEYFCEKHDNWLPPGVKCGYC